MHYTSFVASKIRFLGLELITGFISKWFLVKSPPSSHTTKGAYPRTDWPDIVKGFGIFSVFLIHYFPHDEIRYSAFATYLASFNVPLFFFMGGLFFKDSDLGRNFVDILVRKFNSRMVPYFTFGFITYVLWISFNSLKTSGVLQGRIATVDPLLPLLGMFYGNGNSLPHNQLLWFLPCYFLAESIFYLLRKRITSSVHLIMVVLILALLGFFYTQMRLPYLPFGLEIATVALPFFTFGYLTKKLCFSVKGKWLMIGTLFWAGVFIANSNIRVDMDNRIYGNLFLFYCGGMCNILFLVEISKKVVYLKPTLSYIGKNTLVLMVLQGSSMLVLNGILRYVFQLRPPYANSLIAIIVHASCAMTLLLPASTIINKYTPFLLGIKREKEKIVMDVPNPAPVLN